MEQNAFFPEIKGNFGFGCMRLPQKGGAVDERELCAMVDAFLDAGFNYFDTAHGYHGGASETALKACLTSRYDRSRYLLTNKLTTFYFDKTEDIRPFFERQLSWCGVDYFDFYLMHAQDKSTYEKFKRLNAYETAYECKKEGRIRHFGISFHDRAEVLETILSEHPEIEVVQIQFNYADYEDSSVDSRRVYETCEKFGKPVLVMEPVKGGSLVKLPEKADALLRSLGGGSNASYALRFAASFPNVSVVLSGMSDLAQMRDNLSAMRDFRPVDGRERKALSEVCALIREEGLIPCTGCRYCVNDNDCPKHILIPDLFAAANAYHAFHNWNTAYYYDILTADHGKASDCVKCGKCERICPQHLPIRDLLADVAKTFEKQ